MTDQTASFNQASQIYPQASSNLAGMWTEVDVSRFIDNPPKPSDHWKDEDWEYHCRTEATNQLLAFWGYQQLVQAIGWLEHTNDWDWWMHITYRDGTDEEFASGTYFGAVRDDTGKEWEHPTDLFHQPGLHLKHGYSHVSSKQTFTPLNPVEVLIDGAKYDYEDDDAEWTECVKWVRFDTIRKISVSYD